VSSIRTSLETSSLVRAYDFAAFVPCLGPITIYGQERAGRLALTCTFRKCMTNLAFRQPSAFVIVHLVDLTLPFGTQQTQFSTEYSVHSQNILLNNILFLCDQLSRAENCTEQLSVQICIFLYGTKNILYTEQNIIVCRLSFVVAIITSTCRYNRLLVRGS